MEFDIKNSKINSKVMSHKSPKFNNIRGKHYNGVHGVAGSNPVAPTCSTKAHFLLLL